MSFKIKLILLGVAALALMSYVTWYSLNYVQFRREAVLALVSREWNCPRDKIEIGPSHQFNDGPSEIPVEACGKKALVLCMDDTQKHGMWGQYFAFDLDCWIQKP